MKSPTLFYIWAMKWVCITNRLPYKTPALCEQLQKERVDSAEIDTGLDGDLSLDALKKLGRQPRFLLQATLKKYRPFYPK